MKAYLLTTVDNPYHPIDSFAEWFLFDIIHAQEHGFSCNELLARQMQVLGYSDSFTPSEAQRCTNDAVDYICEYLHPGVAKRIIIDDD